MKGDNKSVLNVPLSDLNYDQMSEVIVDWALNHESRSVGICNVHSVTTAGWNERLRNALLSNDINTTDGVPLVWMLKLLGSKEASRVYGPTLMLYLLAYARFHDLKVALYGGHEDRLKVLVQNLKNRYPGIQIVKAISPAFGTVDPLLQEKYIQELKDSNPHLIFVGLGCPKQEIWMAKHKKQLDSVLVGVGAAFDFHANAVPQAPAYLQKIGMEWSYRLYQEPRRLAKRYLTTNPVFIIRVALQLLSEGISTAIQYLRIRKGPGVVFSQK